MTIEEVSESAESQEEDVNNSLSVNVEKSLLDHKKPNLEEDSGRLKTLLEELSDEELILAI
jgi:hypothetical protein